jgi:hypothetical protein
MLGEGPVPKIILHDVPCHLPSISEMGNAKMRRDHVIFHVTTLLTTTHLVDSHGKLLYMLHERISYICTLETIGRLSYVD